MLRTVLQGIRGQRTTVVLMTLILVISFLFLTLSSVVIHSVQAAQQADRELLYGRFQLLYYGNSSAAEELARDNSGARISRIVGQTNSGQTVAAITPEFQEYANFTLMQGGFPQNSGEILLVGPDAWDYQPGDTIRISYTFHHVAPRQKTEEDGLNVQRILLRSFWADSQKYMDQMEKFWNSFITSEHARDVYPEDMLKPLSELLPYQQEQAFLFAYGAGILREFSSSAVAQYPKDQMTANGMQVYLDLSGSQITLSGEAFGEYRGTVFASEPVLTDTRIDATYTVCGIAENYKSNWVTSGLSMPDAFICGEDYSLIMDTLSQVEQKHPEVLPHSGSSLLLWSGGEKDDMSFLDSYNAMYSSGYKLLGQSIQGNLNRAYLIGMDPTTGNEVVCEVKGDYVTIGETTQYFSQKDLTNPYFRLEGLDPLLQEPLTLQKLYDNNTGILRINSLAYPPVGDSAGTIEILLQGVLICMSVCSCFQIYLQSLKRRRQKLDTLIAIGATDGQIVSMLLMEVVLLLILSCSIGVALAFLTGWVVLKYVMGIPMIWNMIPLLMSYGLMSVAVLLGVLLPIVKILREQLRKNRHKTLKLPVSEQRSFGPGYRYICLRHIRANNRQTILRSVIVLFLCAILLLPVFLIHRSYEPYRQNVTYADRPEYELQLPYATSQRYLNEITADIDLPIHKLRSYVTAENIYLHCDTMMSSSPILQALASDVRGAELFRTLDDGSTGFSVRMIGGTWDSLLVQTVLGSTSSEINREAFDAGKTCILLVPRYRESGGKPVVSEISAEVLAETSEDLQVGVLLDSSLQKVYAGNYCEDAALLSQDAIRISGYTQSLKNSGESLVETMNTVQVDVAAAVCQLEKPLWPLSDGAGVTVLCSSSLLDNVYPNALTRMTAQDSRYFRVASELYYPHCYGKTYVQLWTDESQMDTAAMERSLEILCQEYDFDLVKYHFYNQNLLETAQGSSALYLVLCINMVLITLLLLSNLLREEVEEDRRRLGVLQVLGMTDRQYLLGQSAQMAITGCLSIFLSHMLLMIALCLGFLLQGGGIPNMLLQLKLMLQDFPVWWDLGLCVLYLLVLQIMELYAVLPILHKPPAESIR